MTVTNKQCPACHAQRLHVFLELQQVPIQQNTPKPSMREAQDTTRGDIALAWCESCGFVSNTAFDTSLDIYTPDYNNAQTYSPVFQDYVDSIASMLIEERGLRHKRIVEIGCGQGDFLKKLCLQGDNNGVGFDPSYRGELTALDGRVRFVADFYDQRYADQPGDLFLARHLIEHIPNTGEFARVLRQAIGDNPSASVFFETPDVTWILKNGTFWDIFYEHCALFSPGSLARLFAGNGFNVSRVTPVFGGQYMWLEASPSSAAVGTIPDGLDTPEDIGQMVGDFTRHYQRKIGEMRGYLLRLQAEGQQAAVWGAGAKGVTFLNTLKPGLDIVPFVVDVNPGKQNRYIPGTGQQIIAPAALRNIPVHTVFIMNPNYSTEIQQTLAQLGLTPSIIIL